MYTSERVMQDRTLARKMNPRLTNLTCDEGSDCNYYDCTGQCDVTSGKCKLVDNYNNLQAVCNKVFLHQGDHTDYIIALCAKNRVI